MLVHFCKDCRTQKHSYSAACSCGSMLCNTHMLEHVMRGHEPPRYWRRDALGEGLDDD